MSASFAPTQRGYAHILPCLLHPLQPNEPNKVSKHDQFPFARSQICRMVASGPPPSDLSSREKGTTPTTTGNVAVEPPVVQGQPGNRMPGLGAVIGGCVRTGGRSNAFASISFMHVGTDPASTKGCPGGSFGRGDRTGDGPGTGNQPAIGEPD